MSGSIKVCNEFLDFDVVEIIPEFLPRLFFGKSKSLSPIVGTIRKIPVKKSGLGLLIPVTSAIEKYLGFKCAST